MKRDIVLLSAAFAIISTISCQTSLVNVSEFCEIRQTDQHAAAYFITANWSTTLHFGTFDACRIAVNRPVFAESAYILLGQWNDEACRMGLQVVESNGVTDKVVYERQTKCQSDDNKIKNGGEHWRLALDSDSESRQLVLELRVGNDVSWSKQSDGSKFGFELTVTFESETWKVGETSEVEGQCVSCNESTEVTTDDDDDVEAKANAKQPTKEAKSKKCIDKSLVCDGYVNCYESQLDETHCKSQVSTTSSEWKPGLTFKQSDLSTESSDQITFDRSESLFRSRLRMALVGPLAMSHSGVHIHRQFYSDPNLWSNSDEAESNVLRNALKYKRFTSKWFSYYLFTNTSNVGEVDQIFGENRLSMHLKTINGQRQNKILRLKRSSSWSNWSPSFASSSWASWSSYSNRATSGVSNWVDNTILAEPWKMCLLFFGIFGVVVLLIVLIVNRRLLLLLWQRLCHGPLAVNVNVNVNTSNVMEHRVTTITSSCTNSVKVYSTTIQPYAAATWTACCACNTQHLDGAICAENVTNQSGFQTVEIHSSLVAKCDNATCNLASCGDQSSVDLVAPCLSSQSFAQSSAHDFLFDDAADCTPTQPLLQRPTESTSQC